MGHFRKAVNTSFFHNWSPAMAYVLGYFAADGSMYINSHGSKYVGFTSTDRILLVQVQRLMGSEHRIALKKRRNPQPAWRPAYQIQIGGGELFDQLAALGFTPNKDCSMRFPNVPGECLAHFVRGYFDGDGCIGFGWYQQPDRKCRSLWMQMLFTSGSFEFLRVLDQAIQCESGVHAGYLRHRRGMGCYLYYQRRGDIKKLYAFLYPGHLPAEHYLPRKRQHYQEALRHLGV